MDREDRIALFLDFENLALGVRDHLGGMKFDLRPISDALAERGRVIVRRAYADWSYFDEDRRNLTRAHVELIDIPQRMGASRKNAADLKMAVDALEMAFERDYISTFVMGTGDSDFTPLVHKLREMNKRVIGVGVRNSTSAMLPPACDEFLFYENLEGIDVPAPTRRRRRSARADADTAVAADPAPAPEPRAGSRSESQAEPEPESETGAGETSPDVDRLAILIVQTVAGLERSSSGGEVTASTLKRTLLRKDPTFSEADYGFRAFGELLRHLTDRGVIELGEGPAKGDPEVALPEHGNREDAFELLRSVVAEVSGDNGNAALSGLKNRVRKAQPDFSEKKLGYRSFLQFCRAAETAGFVDLSWDGDLEDYVLSTPRTG